MKLHLQVAQNHQVSQYYRTSLVKCVAQSLPHEVRISLCCYMLQYIQTAELFKKLIWFEKQETGFKDCKTMKGSH